MRAPFRISTAGVSSRKFRKGGVIACRLRASEKNAKTVSRGAGTATRVSSLYGIEAPFYLRMSFNEERRVHSCEREPLPVDAAHLEPVLRRLRRDLADVGLIVPGSADLRRKRDVLQHLGLRRHESKLHLARRPVQIDFEQTRGARGRGALEWKQPLVPRPPAGRDESRRAERERRSCLHDQ